MRFLLDPATRGHRLRILRVRLRALQYGDDAAELYLALHYALWAAVMWWPGDATARAPAWTVIRQIVPGDLGVGLLCTVLAVLLGAGVLRLWTQRAHLISLWFALSCSVGLAVALLLGNPLAVSAYDSLLTALICWLVYLRADRTG